MHSLFMYILCGVAGSGKSTWAKRMAKASDGQILIVNKDSIREMLFGEYSYSRDVEEVVRRIAESSVNSAFRNGFSVIIDETNLTKEKRSVWISKARDFNVNVFVVHVKSDNALDGRMNDPRGISREDWSDIIAKHQEQFEDIVDDELGVNDKIATISMRTFRK